MGEKGKLEKGGSGRERIEGRKETEKTKEKLSAGKRETRTSKEGNEGSERPVRYRVTDKEAEEGFDE